MENFIKNLPKSYVFPHVSGNFRAFRIHNAKSFTKRGCLFA